MQNLNWNDLRYVLAISRRRRLAEAARMLGVDDTTVTRRLSALAVTAGQRLYHRRSDGTLELTEAGTAMAAVAERFERDIGSLNHGTDREEVAGVVRLTSVPFVINRILIPAVGELLAAHRQLRIEMISDAQNLSLTRREADIAIRMARPRIGGLRTRARRIGMLHHAPYVAAAQAMRTAPALPWITYDESMAHLPQARWMSAAIAKEEGQAAQLTINDAEAALEAVAAGHGRSMLPCMIADRDPRLTRTPVERERASWSRELWLLVHSELRALPRIQVVIQWIDQLIERCQMTAQSEKLSRSRVASWPIWPL